MKFHFQNSIQMKKIIKYIYLKNLKIKQSIKLKLHM